LSVQIPIVAPKMKMAYFTATSVERIYRKLNQNLENFKPQLMPSRKKRSPQERCRLMPHHPLEQ